MRIVFVIMLSILILAKEGVAQSGSPFSKTNVYADFGLYYNGSPASLNVEFRLVGKKSFNLYGRLGAALAVDGDLLGGSDLAYGGIAALTLMTGPKNHHFIADLGVFAGMLEHEVYGQGYSWYFYPFPIINVGYRFQKPRGGFIFNAKVGMTGTGIGLGYAF